MGTRATVSGLIDVGVSSARLSDDEAHRRACRKIRMFLGRAITDDELEYAVAAIISEAVDGVWGPTPEELIDAGIVTAVRRAADDIGRDINAGRTAAEIEFYPNPRCNPDLLADVPGLVESGIDSVRRYAELMHHLFSTVYDTILTAARCEYELTPEFRASQVELYNGFLRNGFDGIVDWHFLEHLLGAAEVAGFVDDLDLSDEVVDGWIQGRGPVDRIGTESNPRHVLLWIRSVNTRNSTQERDDECNDASGTG